MAAIMSTPTSITSMGAPTTIEERLASSKIVLEEHLGPLPTDMPIRIIEVPIIEEQVKYVTRKEVREVVKEVKCPKVQYIERVVHVPTTKIVERIEEVPEIQEVVRYVPRKQIIDVPREVIRHIPKVEIKCVEKEMLVATPRRVPRPHLVEKRVVVPHFVDKEVPTVVSQRVVPVVIANSTLDTVEVEVDSFEPVLVPIDVHVPKAVPVEFLDSSVLKESSRRALSVNAEDLYKMFVSMNSAITSKGMPLQMTAAELHALSVGVHSSPDDGHQVPVATQTDNNVIAASSPDAQAVQSLGMHLSSGAVQSSSGAVQSSSGAVQSSSDASQSSSDASQSSGDVQSSSGAVQSVTSVSSATQGPHTATSESSFSESRGGAS